MEEDALLRSLFQRYQRLIIQQEFLSGYSGARTLLLVPIRPDGRADAPTIAKIGSKAAVEHEYSNYEAFVKHTLPPVTARIQSPPVSCRDAEVLGALQYTFIGQPGSKPVSLRQALLADLDPELLQRLFQTFGPNWWMQRGPATFRLGLEYDRLLPPHFILETAKGSGRNLDGASSPGSVRLTVGDLVSLCNFGREANADPEKGYSNLLGKGQLPLRLRWMETRLPRNPVGRVVASRMDLLRSYATGFDLRGLPDPLERLPGILEETITGTQSTIHGDLNLENVLVGPGNLVWLIDFATTREGHPLMDFAHLEAELIAHVIALRVESPDVFLGLLRSSGFRLARKEIGQQAEVPPSMEKLRSLLLVLHEITYSCLANPSNSREYHLALLVSCLGALKYRNLEPYQKYLLYLTAGFLSQGV
jgi:hypothetical protein